MSRLKRLIEPGHLLRRPSAIAAPSRERQPEIDHRPLAYRARGFFVLATHSTPLGRSGIHSHGARHVWSIVAPLAVLAIAVLSIAFGSVSIPPQTVLGVLLAQIPFAHITADWSATAESTTTGISLISSCFTNSDPLIPGIIQSASSNPTSCADCEKTFNACLPLAAGNTRNPA